MTREPDIELAAVKELTKAIVLELAVEIEKLRAEADFWKARYTLALIAPTLFDVAPDVAPAPYRQIQNLATSKT